VFSLFTLVLTQTAGHIGSGCGGKLLIFILIVFVIFAVGTPQPGEPRPINATVPTTTTHHETQQQPQLQILGLFVLNSQPFSSLSLSRLSLSLSIFPALCLRSKQTRRTTEKEEEVESNTSHTNNTQRTTVEFINTTSQFGNKDDRQQRSACILPQQRRLT